MKTWLFGSIFLMLLATMANAADYRHPSGVAFTYPDDWQVRELEESLLLIPTAQEGGSSTPANGLPDRFIWVGAEAVPSDTPIDHPDIAGYFDGAVASVYPQANRSEGVSHGGLLDDSGRLNYNVANDRQVKVRFRLENGLALFMAHSVSTGQEIEDSVFETAFESYRARLRQDAALIGSWYRSESAMTDVTYDGNNGGSSYVSAASQHQYAFRSNNRFEYASGAQVYSQSSSAGATGSASSSGDNPIDGGTYAADGTTLSLAWDEGDSVECPYSIFRNHSNVLTLKLECWEKPRFYTFSN